MSEARWAPHVVVAAVVERQGRFLIVEERIDGETRYNQPAGHLDPDETLVDAAIRECREESGYEFRPQRLIGVYQWTSASGESFVRFAFGGSVEGPHPDHVAEPDIVAVHWLSRAELAERRAQLRSPMVELCVDAARCGEGVPLSVLNALE